MRRLLLTLAAVGIALAALAVTTFAMQVEEPQIPAADGARLAVGHMAPFAMDPDTSVTVTLASGKEMTHEIVEGFAKLVAGGVAGLKPHQVNITDARTMRSYGLPDPDDAASFDLLLAAYGAAVKRGIEVHVGGIFSGDRFYNGDPDWWRIWSDYGTLACEMESNGLYTLAAKLQIAALSILTVSDSLVTGETATAEQRERGFPRMAELALEIVT